LHSVEFELGAQMTRPLWQLPLEMHDPEKVHKIVNHHLALCSSCGTQLDDLLKKLEISLTHQSNE